MLMKQNVNNGVRKDPPIYIYLTINARLVAPLDTLARLLGFTLSSWLTLFSCVSFQKAVRKIQSAGLTFP